MWHVSHVSVENDYENIGIDSWAAHTREMHANSDIKFTEEYEAISKPANQDLTWKESLEPANIPKNRYNNVIACNCHPSCSFLASIPSIITFTFPFQMIIHVWH